MANIIISRRFPPSPSKGAVMFGLPVASGTLVPLVDGLSALAGWRALRSASWTVDHAPAQSPVRPYIRSAPDAGPFVTRVWMDIGDISTAVRVALVYQAAARASVLPSIKVDIYKGFGGATFRDGIIFDTAANTLPASRARSGLWPVMTALAPVSEGPSAPAVGNPTTPRLLNLDAGDRRETMELRITATSARVLFVYAVEGYRGVVPQ